MDTLEKFFAIVLLSLVCVMLIVLFAASNASVQTSNRYEKACTERGGVVVYNGKHYECFVK